MKKFMYLSIGVLCLAVSALIGFHVGSRAVQAQPVTTLPFGFSTDVGLYHILLENGDVYYRRSNGDSSNLQFVGDTGYVGNIWSSPPVSTTPSTMGDMKSRYGGDKND